MAHVVERPNVRNVVGAVLQNASERRLGRNLGVIVFRRDRLEGRSEILCEEIESCADTLPFFERGGCGRR